jgi:hypothetical protein
METLNFNSFLNYYIIDRIKGISYNPSMIIYNKKILATSNIATDKHEFIIDINRLVKGLNEKRYRLRLKLL